MGTSIQVGGALPPPPPPPPSSSHVNVLAADSDHLTDALLLYLKSMALVKRAVELGRSLVEDLRAHRR